MCTRGAAGWHFNNKETGKILFVSLYKHLIACFRNDSLIVHLWSSWGVPDIPREAWIWSYKKLEKTWFIYMLLSCLNLGPKRICNVYCVYTFLGGSPPALLQCVLFYCEAFTLSSGIHNTTNPLRFFFLVFFSSSIHIHIGTGTLNAQCWTVEDLGSNSTWARFILPERSGSKLGLLYGTPDHLGWWDVSSWWIRVC